MQPLALNPGDRVQLRTIDTVVPNAISGAEETRPGRFHNGLVLSVSQVQLVLVDPSTAPNAITHLAWSEIESCDRVGTESVPDPLIRTYKGKQQADATVAYTSDAAVLSKLGYVPTTQSWAAGQWGAGTWLLALLLSFVIFGLVIFVYMLIVKPEGTMTVTFRRDPAIAPPHTPPAGASVPAAPITAIASGDGAPGDPTSGHSDIPALIRSLGELKDSGLLTEEEFMAKKADLLGRL